MFLDVLQERNKEMFLKACVSAAAPDRCLTEKEKEAFQDRMQRKLPQRLEDATIRLSKKGG